MHQEQKRIEEEQQNRQHCEFALREKGYQKKSGELEKAYWRKAKELAAREKKMNNLEKEFQNLMEDQEFKICEIEQKYDRKVRKLQEEWKNSR